MWMISLEVVKGEAPLLYRYQDENLASKAFDRLATTHFYRLMLWEPNSDDSVSAMHEFACLFGDQ